jgi:hypothetical protein
MSRPDTLLNDFKDYSAPITTEGKWKTPERLLKELIDEDWVSWVYDEAARPTTLGEPADFDESIRQAIARLLLLAEIVYWYLDLPEEYRVKKGPGRPIAHEVEAIDRAIVAWEKEIQCTSK